VCSGVWIQILGGYSNLSPASCDHLRQGGGTLELGSFDVGVRETDLILSPACLRQSCRGWGEHGGPAANPDDGPFAVLDAVAVLGQTRASVVPDLLENRVGDSLLALRARWEAGAVLDRSQKDPSLIVISP